MSPAQTRFWGWGAALLKGAGDLGGSCPYQESAGHLCSNKGRADPELHPQGNTNRDRTVITPLCSVLDRLHLEYSPAGVSTIQERHRQTGDSPKEGHKGDQRAGEPALCGKI